MTISKLRFVRIILTLLVTTIGQEEGVCESSSDLKISVVSSQHISKDNPDARHVESWLAVNPKDANHLIAASMVFGDQDGVSVYVSRNGGKNWSRSVQSGSSLTVFGGIDPAVAFDQKGNAYLVTLPDRLYVYKSTDGGSTWGPAVFAVGGDRPFIGTDSRGNVYVPSKLSITVFGYRGADWHPDLDVAVLARSTDTGTTFGNPKLVLLTPGKQMLNVLGDLLITPDDQIIIMMQTYPPQDLLAPLVHGSYSIIVSNDGGRSFSEPRNVGDFRIFGHSSEGKSLFGAGFARIAQDDSSGKNRGHLYATWLSVVDGYYHVMSANSADGINWSPPVQVDDNFIATDVSNAAIAVNDQGIVGISWYDRRNDPSDRCFELFFAASSDGGKTFSKSYRIEQSLTCPISWEPDLDPIASEYRFKNGGDTMGIVGTLDGFQLAWINGILGELQLWSTTMQVTMDPEVAKNEK